MCWDFLVRAGLDYVVEQKVLGSDYAEEEYYGDGMLTSLRWRLVKPFDV